MPGEERTQKIESYGNAYTKLVEALKQFPQEMWSFKPTPDDWSVHEIVVHITDSEVNSYIRCRRFIVEPGKPLMAYDEKLWATVLDYHGQSTEDALGLFQWLRANTYKLIKTLPDSVWSNTVYHPENGTMTLDDWLDTYERHVPEHIEQMQRNYQAWAELTGVQK
jgi:hypothetical protein